jgi:hypothetical protein
VVLTRIPHERSNFSRRSSVRMFSTSRHLLDVSAVEVCYVGIAQSGIQRFQLMAGTSTRRDGAAVRSFSASVVG